MFNYEDILANLQDGVSAEEIAKAFTDSLNQAMKVQEEEKAKLAQKQEIAADAQKVADVFNWFTQKHYGDVAKGESIKADDILAIYDLISSLDIKVDKLKNGVATTVKFGEDMVDSVIDKFFKRYGL